MLWVYGLYKYLKSESDVYRRQILTTKVYPGTVRVNICWCVLGAEYVAIAASERIHSAESELSRIQKQSRQIKTEIASVEAAIIERTMELEKQREAEAEQNATSNDEDESVTKVKEEPVDDDYETATAMEGS